MLIQKIYIDASSRATILCSNCGRSKVADVSRYTSHDGSIKVRCSCGFIFAFELVKRRQYRKAVKLWGEYIRMGAVKEVGEIIVEDLSRTGLAFSTILKNNIRVNDILKTKFVLDNPQKSMIVRNVVVKRINGRSIGAEFCDNQVDKNLAFYLMP